MRKGLYSVAAVVALAWAATGAAHASTVIDVTNSGSAFLPVNAPNNVSGTGTGIVSAYIQGKTALSFTNGDWFDFKLGNGSGTSSVTVDNLGNIYQGETFTLTDTTTSAVLLNNISANNTPNPGVILSFGDIYQFVFDAGAPTGLGQTSGQIEITASSALGTPLPGTLALFAGGLGLLAFSGMRKRRKNPGGLRLTLA